MLEYKVNPNDSVFLRLQLAKADIGLYPQAKIYAIDAPTAVVDTVNLTELSNGLYGIEWINDGVKKKYFTQTIVYTDSGHTSVHPIIRPDSDSINVDFGNTGGGVYNLGGKRTVKVERLTEEEIRQIVKALYELLKPEFDKKSEFNSAVDLVKTEPLDIKNLVENISLAINKNKIPEYPKMLNAKEISQELAELIKPEKVELPDFSLMINEAVGNIKLFNKTEIRPIKKIKTIIREKKPDEVESILMEIRAGMSILSIYKKYMGLNAINKKVLVRTLIFQYPNILLKLGQIAKLHKLSVR